MLYFFSGSDRDAAREALNTAVEKEPKKNDVLRITDAHSAADVRMALQGPGMFGAGRVVIFDGLLGGNNEEAQMIFLDSLKSMRDSKELFFVLEGALDATTRKQVEKYAEENKRFDAKKGERDNAIFALANYLQRGDKKNLWIGLMREFEKGAAPEAVHGLLFWAAKQGVLRSRGEQDAERARRLVTALAELPHVARRKGEDLSYALERFALSGL